MGASPFEGASLLSADAAGMFIRGSYRIMLGTLYRMVSLAAVMFQRRGNLVFPAG